MKEYFRSNDTKWILISCLYVVYSEKGREKFYKGFGQDNSACSELSHKFYHNGQSQCPFFPQPILCITLLD